MNKAPDRGQLLAPANVTGDRRIIYGSLDGSHSVGQYVQEILLAFVLVISY